MHGIDRTHKAARALAGLKVPAWVLGNVPRQLLLVDSAVGLMSKQILLKIGHKPGQQLTYSLELVSPA